MDRRPHLCATHLYGLQLLWRRRRRGARHADVVAAVTAVPARHRDRRPLPSKRCPSPVPLPLPGKAIGMVTAGGERSNGQPAASGFGGFVPQRGRATPTRRDNCVRYYCPTASHAAALAAGVCRAVVVQGSCMGRRAAHRVPKPEPCAPAPTPPSPFITHNGLL